MFKPYKLPILLAVLFATWMCHSPVQADLVLTFGFAGDADTIDNTGDSVPTFAPGDVFSMNVYAHHTEASTIDVDAFNFVIDFGADGTSDPGPFIVDNGTGFTSAIGGTLTVNDAPTPVLPFDVGATWLGPDFTLSADNTNPTLLFSIDGTLDAGATPGIYDITSIGTAISFSLGGTPITAAPPYVFDVGQIEITGVPEPGTFMLLGMSLLGVGLRRRRI